MHWLAEERIKAAVENGEFKDIHGKGKPLELEDLSHIPAELRMGYKLLRNAGILPEAVQLNKEIDSLSGLLAVCGDARERAGLQKELSAKRLRLQSLAGARGWEQTQAFADYQDQILARLEGDKNNVCRDHNR